LHPNSLTGKFAADIMPIFQGHCLRAACCCLALLGDAGFAAEGASHWSFQPLSPSQGPQSVDEFIDAMLARNGLKRSPPSSPETFVRRITLDLTGLPPSPQEVQEFVREAGAAGPGMDEACARLADRLLASERYGERWAQHWLDVVRYADTHGFEVNTERPNAWPYRDYVIGALNADTPYDRFIREQLAGDMLGQDAATGFLVTASVLLPGQIGKDAPSIRLARQDSLDEIVVNIGQTFLGLSVGCARCHDHKTDPLTQQDYYSMQAFVAGVEYEEREMRSPEAEARKQSAAPLREKVAGIDRRLAELTPPARPQQVKRNPSNSRENAETFAPVEARFVRFTIHDANLHPSLGLIEPCIDEFEIFTDESPPRNVALAALGTKVTASGSRTSEIHRLEHINDGRFGNSRSWMSDEPGRGWVCFEFARPERITKIVWSRDREGVYSDRLATAFTLEAALDPDKWKVLAEVAPRRPTVNPRQNIDRFAPARAKRLKFTILATNSLEPCIDEIEVFNAAGENVASAASGAKILTSGDTTVPGRHEAGFVNDGRYGNERSWMSDAAGKGWIEVEFASEEEISRVAWGRDREGKFEDRMPTDYQIEIADGGDGWRLVADGTDRRPFVAGMDNGPAFSTAGLSPAEKQEFQRLQGDRQALVAQIAAAVAGQSAFAGKFRLPDTIHVLNRGDPEQPLAEVAPAAPKILSGPRLPATAGESDRRRALADWIASPLNPLTARVMVNRVWQGHFGCGLVETPSDFGRGGAKPSHPELLDWLAAEFIRGNWSLKRLHRLIVLSGTYRQSSSPQDAAARSSAERIDHDARLLWRFPSRRLEAEAIRDSMLFASGRLNVKMFGRGFDLFDKRGGLEGFQPVESFSGDGLRRMIYAHKVRREREAVFGAFDCPDAGQSAARRRESTTPLQALNLFNSRFTLECAAAFAERVKMESPQDVRQQIALTYCIALGRMPLAGEINDAEPAVREHGLEVLCRALLNSSEFVMLP
jgi:hypothetical protein